jgi:prepilin-type N-terminal cleavage/methylation domain-containing protein
MTRRGFTLTELLIATVVMGILGVALLRVLASNSRFVSLQDAMAESRATARAGMQLMTSELRMVPDSGLLYAHSDSIRVSIPYVYGMACRSTGGITTGSLMPVDSLMYAAALPDTIALLDPGGTAFIRRRVTLSGSPSAANCTADSIRVVPGGRLIALSISGSDPPSGSLFYLSQTVTYRFMNSADLPGRRGLWRRVQGGSYEELAAPYDTAARFTFLMARNPEAQIRNDLTTRPQRDSVRGIEIRLTGASVRAPQGSSAPLTFDLRSRVMFLNKSTLANQAVP